MNLFGDENTQRTVLAYSIILGIIGGFGSLIYSYFQSKKLSESPLVNIQSALYPSSRTVMGITDTSYKSEYLNYVNQLSESKYIEFPFATMRTNLQVYLLEYSNDSSLVFVARDGKSTRRGDRGYQELWISSMYILAE